MSRRGRGQPVTLLELGEGRLGAVCRALGYGEPRAQLAQEAFRKLAGAWGSARVSDGPRWPSDITDDHTPFEFSVAIDGARPEVRFLVEPHGDVPSMDSNWEATRCLNRAAAVEFGASLGRLRAVEDLFAPTALCPRFAAWCAVGFPVAGPPEIKVYFNPQARGRTYARRLVTEAMARIGFGNAEALLVSDSPDSELCYFSLDLSDRPDARVKVYTAHHGATTAEIEQAVSTGADYVAGRATAFCRAMGGCEGPFDKRSVLTCLAFVEGRSRPTMATVHFPVRGYAPDDRVIRERVLDYLPESSAATFQRAIEGFADRPLGAGAGMQTYVSLRLGGERVTIYLAPEAYRPRDRTPEVKVHDATSPEPNR